MTPNLLKYWLRVEMLLRAGGTPVTSSDVTPPLTTLTSDAGGLTSGDVGPTTGALTTGGLNSLDPDSTCLSPAPAH